MPNGYNGYSVPPVNFAWTNPHTSTESNAAHFTGIGVSSKPPILVHDRNIRPPSPQRVDVTDEKTVLGTPKPPRS